MQYYLHPKNFTFEQIKKEFEELTSNISHIFEIRLIGGEPFMNKEIYDRPDRSTFILGNISASIGQIIQSLLSFFPPAQCKKLTLS